MKTVSILLMVLMSSVSQAGELKRENVKGVYHLGTPERGKTQVTIDMGTLAGKTVLAVGCQGCPTATYSFLEEQSKTLDVATFFNPIGLYVFQYDDESWIIVQPDGELGRQKWNAIAHANIYSKNPNKSKSVDRTAIEKFAIELSSKIMNQEVGTMKHSAGTYFLAVPQEKMGKSRDTFEINFVKDGKKRIDITPCSNCGVESYEHLPEESAMAGIDIYRHATSYYLFDLQDGVLIYTFSNGSGLGRVLWGSNHHYNVYSNNQAYIRQILADKTKQDMIDKLMAEYFATIRTEFENLAKAKQQQQYENQQLPKQGLTDTAQRVDAKKAAERWATAWNWKETILDAFFHANDWSVTRNPISGVVTGKIIRGFVTMKHPDGRCRFQYVTFRQDHDGSQFFNLHMTGVGPIYDLKCENLN